MKKLLVVAAFTFSCFIGQAQVQYVPYDSISAFKIRDTLTADDDTLSEKDNLTVELMSILTVQLCIMLERPYDKRTSGTMDFLQELFNEKKEKYELLK